MRAGIDRGAAEYVWPASLLPSVGGRPVIYLDLNHWISLAKADTDHRDGARFRDALEFVRHLGDRVVIPLASVHYMEMGAIADPQQRFAIAGVMEELTGFACIVPRSTVIRLEIDAGLARIVQAEPRFTRVGLLGHGVMQAFGKRGGLQVRLDDGEVVTSQIRELWPDGEHEFDEFIRSGELLLDRSVLRGPTDAEAPALRERGWDPTGSRAVAEDRAASERELVQQLDDKPGLRRGRLRDAVAARYLANEVLPLLLEALQLHGIALTDIAVDRDAGRRFVDAMPSADAWISLLTARHRNSQLRWEPNDMFDLDAMSVAIPYCDVVVTDRHACRVANVAGLPERLGATVIATLDELVATLGDLL
jgi:hypothetical protein